MTKRPTYLKALVEKRARAQGDERRLLTLTEQLTAELGTARQIVASCDVLLRDFDERIDPSQIESIRQDVGSTSNGARCSMQCSTSCGNAEQTGP